MFQKFGPMLVLACFPAVSTLVAAQPGERFLRQRVAPCQTQYSQAVETIGLARWSAPVVERPSIERLLNAAAKAKELVDASFAQYEPSLCSGETLGRLHASVNMLQSNGWLPATPDERRSAQAAAVNAELLKAMDAGMNDFATPSVGSGPSRTDTLGIRRLSD